MNRRPLSETETTRNPDYGLTGLTAHPHQVGLLADRLERISPTVQQFIDDAQLAGAVTVVARCGKVAHFEAFGMMDLEAPASKYLPEFGAMQVAEDSEAEEVTLVAAGREFTVRDLMRHTSGLPGAIRYMAVETGVDGLYRKAGLNSLHKFDLREMVDTGFFVPAEKIDRLSGLFGPKPHGGLQAIEASQGGTGNSSPTAFTTRPKFLSAGGGLVSTAADFVRFCLMLSNKGVLSGKRLLKAESVEEMTRNQLPKHLIPLDKKPEERYAGLGFGLGVSVRVHQTDWVPASQVGEYGWMGGTSAEFWISPRDELVAITLAQYVPFSELSRVVKPLIYAAIMEEK